MSDLLAFARDLAEDTQAHVKAAVAAAVAPLEAQIKALQGTPIPGPAGEPGRDADVTLIAELKAEVATLRAELAAVPRAEPETLIKSIAAEVARIPVPRDGKDADLEMIQAFVDAAVTKAIAAIPPPKDGRDGVSVDPAVVDVMVQAQVERAVKAIPVPKDGQSVTVEDVRPLVKSLVEVAVAEIPAPKDGKDGEKGEDGKHATVADVLPFVSREIQDAVAALPKPENGLPGARGEDGRSVTVADVEPLISELVTKAVSAIPAPKDGVGLVDFIIDRDGHLIATLTDGRTKDLGPIHGKDVDPDYVERKIAEIATKAIEALPKPKDGVDGKDGFGFDDFSYEYDDMGRLYHKMERDGVVKRAMVPGFIDAKVWRAGNVYRAGDAVTHNRSLFICQKDLPTGKPEDSSGDWRLAVMRGRDAQPPKPHGDE